MESIGIEVIPAFEDNYLYVLYKENKAVVVDPGDGQLVLNFLNSKKLRLVGILATHHHADHVGGISILKQNFENVDIFAFEEDAYRIPHANQLFSANKKSFTILPKKLLGVEFSALHCPGHTHGHVVFKANFCTEIENIEKFYLGNKLNSAQNSHYFVGDCIFGGGSGYLFEGSYLEMNTSLQSFVQIATAEQKSLGCKSFLWCAHEYTKKNLEIAKLFAKSTSFETKIVQKLQKIALFFERFPDGKTVPLELEDELNTNLFLNSQNEELAKCKNTFTSVELFQLVRDFRNNY